MPVPLIHLVMTPSFGKIINPCLFKDLFYTFEKRRAVLNLKLSSNPNILPQGCTTLINHAFLKNFETHHESTYGTVEIQFDSNFADP